MTICTVCLERPATHRGIGDHARICKACYDSMEAFADTPHTTFPQRIHEAEITLARMRLVSIWGAPSKQLLVRQ